ncbi:MAG TPA: hypothetical protein VKB18_07325 [Gemmatimonadota bacterium]|nr:hypothetical protein [Gemmatimonadota bacterium]
MSLEALLAAIERGASEEAARLVDEARAEAARLEAEAAGRLARRREASTSAWEADLRSRAEAGVAAVRREARESVLEAREELLERAFAAAVSPDLREAALGALRASLDGRLSRALACLDPVGAVVSCSPSLCEDVRGHLAEIRPGPSGEPAIEVRPDPEITAGLRIAAADGRVEVDVTLQGRLDRARRRAAIEALSAFYDPPGGNA